MVPWRTSQCELRIYVWTKCLSYQNLAENLLLRWNIQNIQHHQHQSICSRFVDMQWMPKNSGTGYEAEKLKELGFTVRELTDHYNAQEIMAAQFPKEWNVWVFACSFWGMHRDKQMFKRIWSASIIYTSLRDYTFSQHWLLAWVEGPAASLSYDCLRAETKRHLGYWKSGG